VTTNSAAIITSKFTPLARYLLAAVLVRVCTGCAAVAVILLARSTGADGTLIGALTACLTAPHILGPLYGKWLEQSNKPFALIASACVAFTVCFHIAIANFASSHLWIVFSALLLSGACSSFMMGGLSTQLNHLVDQDVMVKRRAQSWDNLTYGLGLTIGPLLIAVFSSLYSAKLAASVLMCLPLVAMVLLLSLPNFNKKDPILKQQVPSAVQIIKTLSQTRGLKITFLMTSCSAFSFSALPVLAVYISELFQQGQERGAYLVTLYGIGCLCGAALLIVKPLVKDSLILLRNIAFLLLICLGFLALSTYTSFSGEFSIAHIIIYYTGCGIFYVMIYHHEREH